MKATKFFLLLFIITSGCMLVQAQDTLADITHLFGAGNSFGNVDYYETDSINSQPLSKQEKDLIKKYADMMNVDENSITNISLYQFIDDWYATPYHYSGNSKSGIDCSGFTARLQQDVFNKSVSGSAASIYNLCEPLKKDELKEGDLVFFKIGKSYVSHVGVYLTNNYFVHASTQAGVIISSLDESYYTKYFFSGGKLKD